MANEVTLLRGQTSVAIPIRIVDDALPEVSETFLIRLDQVSGGGVLGTAISTNIIIQASDDPNGAFGKWKKSYANLLMQDKVKQQ